MTPRQILRHLLETAASHVEPPLLNERKIARMAWVERTAARWREAHRLMDSRGDDAVDCVDEEAFERLVEAEQAKVDAIRAPLQAVVDEDRWPEDLHFKCV